MLFKLTKLFLEASDDILVAMAKYVILHYIIPDIFLCCMLETDIIVYFQELIIDMKGGLCPSTRSVHWKSKRVFFVTPQVLQNDIQSGDYF